MKTPSLLLAILLLCLPSGASAGRIEHAGCYAEWADRELVIGNTLIERRWSIDQGLLTPVSFRDKPSGIEWLRRPGRQAAPHPGGNFPMEPRKVSFLETRKGKVHPVEAESLSFVMTATGPESLLTYGFQIFPKSRGVTMRFVSHLPETSLHVPETAEEAAPTGVEKPAAKKRKARPAIDALEDLILAPRHLRYTQVELMDQTDRNNELVFEREWLPLHDGFTASCNVFFAEEPLTGRGLVFLKLAPLPHARPVKSEWDVRVAGNDRRLVCAGHGYPWTVLSYSGGRPGRIAAMQDYQRCLRAYDPQRDAMFLSNTWGDRSRDSRVTEAFLRKEIEAGARLGVDVIQVDDGWQKGRSQNSAFGKGAWGRFHEADPEFWSPHPERFPNGLKPLVEEARAKGMKFGLWFGPDAQDDMKSWQRDADLLLGAFEKEGVEYVKIDAVEMLSTTAEQNLRSFYDRVLTRTEGRVVFDQDATAGIRPGYFGMLNAGPIFVENRYSDWHKYWPHLTLRNLWKLSLHVDPLRLRMEFLNNQRNAAKYEGDPLAPSLYPPDTLFASVMFGNPLGWFEVSNLPDEYFKTVPQLVTAWKQEREAIFSGHIIPIGNAPDGVSWTGFASVSEDRQSARVVVFRELNEHAEWSVKVPLLAGKGQNVTLLGGNGSATMKDGVLTATIPEKLRYLFLRIAP